MPDDIKPLEVPKVKGFQPGHPRYGGRKKGSGGNPIKRSMEARAIAEKMNFHPVEFLSQCALGKMPNADGTYTELDVNQRLDAAKSVAPYIAPKLNATTLTGKDDGPIQTQALPTDKILADPRLSSALGDLALLVAQASPEDVALDALQ